MVLKMAISSEEGVREEGRGEEESGEFTHNTAAKRQVDAGGGPGGAEAESQEQIARHEGSQGHDERAQLAVEALQIHSK